MRRIIFVIIRACFIIFILNLITNNYFSYSLLNIFVLSMLSIPGIIVIYLISLL